MRVVSFLITIYRHSLLQRTIIPYHNLPSFPDLIGESHVCLVHSKIEDCPDKPGNDEVKSIVLLDRESNVLFSFSKNKGNCPAKPRNDVVRSWFDLIGESVVMYLVLKNEDCPAQPCNDVVRIIILIQKRFGLIY